MGKVTRLLLCEALLPLADQHKVPVLATRRGEVHKMEPTGFEPVTSSMPLRRSTN